MKIILISTFYNAPHFMELQLNSLKEFIQDDFDLIVMNDASDDVKSLLPDELAQKEITEEAKRLGLRHILVPQDIHKNTSDGGLVPEGLPANHPTEGRRTHLHWIFQNIYKICHNYDIMVLLEFDMFIKKKLNVSGYLDDFDLMGPARTNVKIIRNPNPNSIWPDKIKDRNEITLNFFPMYMLIANLNTVKNLNEINIGGFAGTDTGGQTGLFINENPNYRSLKKNAPPFREGMNFYQLKNRSLYIDCKHEKIL